MLVFQGESSLERATTHEVARSWFYSLVGNDQARDPWLDESLATYAQAGTDGIMDYLRGETIPSDGIDRVGESMTYWADHPGAYSPGVYVQGALAFDSLGPQDLVDCALRLFVAEHANGIATPEDLVASVSTVIPDARERLARFGIFAEAR